MLGIFLPSLVSGGQPSSPPGGVFHHLEAVLASHERDSNAVASRQQAGFNNQVMAMVQSGILSEEEGQALIDRARPYGCWEMGPVTNLESGVCGYSSASAELGSVTVSAYFSPVHPHTCYLQSSDDEDIYDGGCNEVGVTGVGAQFMMNYECNGVPYSTGWLDAPLYDAWCGRGRDITACEFQVRVPSCLEE